MKRRLIDVYGNVVEERPERTRLQRRLAEGMHKTHAPWSDLPWEMLLRVLRFAVDRVYRHEHVAADVIFRLMMPYAHVCSNWRRTIKITYHGGWTNHVYVSWDNMFAYLNNLNANMKTWIFDELHELREKIERQQHFSGMGAGFDLSAVHYTMNSLSINLRRIHGSFHWRNEALAEILDLYADKPRFLCEGIPDVKRVNHTKDMKRDCCAMLKYPD